MPGVKQYLKWSCSAYCEMCILEQQSSLTEHLATFWWMSKNDIDDI